MFNSVAQGQDMMEQLRARRDELEQAAHSLLKPEIDYTMVDERRLCLLKPGAEKLCDYFGYIVQYDLVQSSASHVNEQAMYIVKAILTSWQTGEKVSEGLGLASSQESRYEGQSSMDVANTILKMAKKRAMVDAVISAVGGSFLFTQDLEDRESSSQPMKQNNGNGFQQNKGGQYNQNNQNYSNNRNSYPQNGYGKNGNRSYGNQNKSGKSGNRNSGNNSAKATESQISYIENLVSKLRINRQQLCAELQDRFQVDDYRKLSKQQASDFIQQLQAS